MYIQTISDEDLGAIEASRDNVRQEPYSLPKNFEWDDVDVSSTNQKVTSLTFF